MIIVKLLLDYSHTFTCMCGCIAHFPPRKSLPRLYFLQKEKAFEPQFKIFVSHWPR